MKATSLKNLLLLTSLLLIILFRIHLMFFRFIDVDEFSHLHWTYLISIGKIPFKDFFFYITPLFQWFLLPVVSLPPGPYVVLVARYWTFLLYIANTYFLYRLTYWSTRKISSSLLASLIFVVFPMTLDKTIDMRPDTLMIFFFLSSLLLLTLPKVKKKIHLIFSGLCFALGFLTLSKLIFAVPTILTAILLTTPKKQLFRSGIIWGASAVVPGLLFLFYLLYHNLLPTAFLHMTHSALMVNQGKSTFSPWAALSPFPLVYVGNAGVSWPWIVGTAIWISAIIGLIRLWLIHKLLACILSVFYVFGAMFLFAFPAPYLQYFLPLSIFASFLSSLTITYYTAWIEKRFNQSLLGFLFVAVIVMSLMSSFIIQYFDRNSIGGSNIEQLTVIRDLLKISKSQDTFHDMVGSYVFRPDAYYICCHPYGEFRHNLKIQLPSLMDSFRKNQNKFVIMDRNAMVFWQTPESERSWLYSNFLPTKYYKIYSLGKQFKCNNGICRQYDFDNRSISTTLQTMDIMASDKYQLNISPVTSNVFIDGLPLTQGVYFFNQGIHTFKPDSYVVEFSYQLDR